MKNSHRIAASFRDPSGFLFVRGGRLYRQINIKYADNYEELMGSGLYKEIVKRGWMVPHEEVDIVPEHHEEAYKIISPQKVNFVSYPYEWSFSQLKDSALLTLKIQKFALKYGMSLKDSSAYNIQFHQGRPILIDTLSFEMYSEGQPWVAYRQFCQHFLAPLSLMSYKDIRLSQLLQIYIDGVPLDLASKLLPRKTRFNFGLQMHVHLHAKSQKQYADQHFEKNEISGRVSKAQLHALIESLQDVVKKLTWKPEGTEWGDYYQDTNYSELGQEAKMRLVSRFVDQIKPATVWDFGGNTGKFSRISSGKDIPTVSFDIDPAAVEQNYRETKKNKEKSMLPLVLDLTNPSPNLGWRNLERNSINERGPAHTIMALALVHHLAISNNVPLDQIAEYFSSLGEWLIIEFVPKTDSQVQRLLSTREDIFPDYTPSGFETAFSEYFEVVDVESIEDTERLLYLMKKLKLRS